MAPSRFTQAVILSGGLGSRLRPIVGEKPKGLAPIRGKPILGYLLDKLDSQGIHHVLLAVGYRAESIAEALGTRWGQVRIRYSVEPDPLGTGGALRLAASVIDPGPTFVLNGDTYLDLDFQRFGAACAGSGSPLGMALAEVGDATRYHVVECRDHRVQTLAPGRPGPGYVNSGTYWFAGPTLAELPDRPRFSLEDEFLSPYVRANDVYAYLATRNFVDVGTPADYLACQTDDRFG